MSNQVHNPDVYTYSVVWNPGDQAFSATVAEFPTLRWNARTPDAAIAELKAVVHQTVDDLVQTGGMIPRPFPRPAVPAPPLHPQYAGPPTFQFPTQSINQSVNIRNGRGFVGTSHTFHLVMTVCTCGMWAPVWAFMAIVNGSRNVRR